MIYKIYDKEQGQYTGMNIGPRNWEKKSQAERVMKKLRYHPSQFNRYEIHKFKLERVDE